MAKIIVPFMALSSSATWGYCSCHLNGERLVQTESLVTEHVPPALVRDFDAARKPRIPEFWMEPGDRVAVRSGEVNAISRLPLAWT